MRAHEAGPNVAEVLERLLQQVLLNRTRLDAALSRVEPGIKNAVAIAAGAVLRRPDFFTPAGRTIPWDSFGDGTGHGRAVEWIGIVSRAASAWLGSVAIEHGKALRPARQGASAIEAFPPMLVAEWKRHWNEDGARELAGILGESSGTTLRVVRGEDREKIASRILEEAAVELRTTGRSPLGLRSEDYAPVLGTSAFREGLCEIQDEGSQIMSLFALWPDFVSPFLTSEPGSPGGDASDRQLPRWSRDGWTVVDACAGAGGKTLAMADLLGGRGRVFGYDVASSKVEALRRRARRLGLSNIQAVLLEEGREAEALQRFARKADVVLVDAPCSGWGVLRRNPDIKFHQTSEDLMRLEKLQARLLQVYSMLVRPGGRLVFGACTFRPEETTLQVERFLDGNPGFERGASGYFGPDRDSDGFFMASMVMRERAG
jgi:16S rRNA C967 or C1407 C5-methylase (RsmB/RsmF family)